MKGFLKTITFVFFILVGRLEPLSAATLAVYDFATNLNPASSDPSVTATAFGGVGTARSINSYAYQFTQTGNSGYMDFSLTATGGQLLDLTSIAFSYDFMQTSGTMTVFTGTIALYYSTDSFATSTLVQSFNEASAAVVPSGATTFTSAGTLGLSAIPDSNSVSFRFVLSNNGSLNTNAYRYGIDSVTLIGNVVAVPEPSSVSLILMALVLGYVFWKTGPCSVFKTDCDKVHVIRVRASLQK